MQGERLKISGAHLSFAHPTIDIAKIRDYSQSRKYTVLTQRVKWPGLTAKKCIVYADKFRSYR